MTSEWLTGLLFSTPVNIQAEECVIEECVNVCYMQNRSNIGYINVRKVAMGAAILDFDRWSRVHALNVGLYRVHALNARQQSYNLSMCRAFRVVVFQNSIFIWTWPDSRILGKFPYEIRQIPVTVLVGSSAYMYVHVCVQIIFSYCSNKSDFRTVHKNVSSLISLIE